MPLKARLGVLLSFAALVSITVAAPALASEQTGLISASFVLALGRTPTLTEIAACETCAPLPLATQIAHRREQLRHDPAAQRAVIVKAWQDAFGRTPDAGEIEAASVSANTYTELMQRHLAWLAAHPADYAQVLHRAYRFLLQRDAYELELDYWKPQGVLPYALLVACIDDWARRNQPGLMVTTGVPTASVNSRYLATVRLSPAQGAPARAAAGLEPAGDRALAIAAGRNLVAAGAERITSSGAIHFVAAGAADLVSAQAR